jgi:signal transduction histidine kinase
MGLRQNVAFVHNLKRPTLRVQLTLLYSGLFLGVLAAALLATNLLYGHTAAVAPGGSPAAPGTAAGHIAGSNQQFDVGPALIGLAAAVIALAGAWWLAGRFLRPLSAITATAQEISATKLNRRLDLTGPNDELTQLGNTLDNLFGRLESSFDAQRHFVANASHELRTPLAGQRTLLQVALADPHADTASLRAACEEALQLGDQQEQLIDALLTLATSERGVQHWQPFDLAQITETVLAGRRHEAEHRDLRIDTALVAAPATGDPRLVELLVTNLIDNALRHNTTGGRVEVSTLSSPGRATITVSNSGPTVPPDQIERLFQPFQQTGGQRVHHTDGHGLGLTIVQAIAQAHDAKIRARSRSGGGLDIAVSFTALDASSSKPESRASN